jgi:hydroxypyruvate isomerase
MKEERQMTVDVLLDLFFTDQPMDRRIARIAETGWRHVETWKGGNAEELKAIGRACRDCGASLVSIVMNGIGEKDVSPVRAENRKAFVERMDRYADNALAAGCSAGIVTSGDRVSGVDYYRQSAALAEALAAAAGPAARKGFRLNLEPLNDKVDHPGYFLTSREEAVEIVRQVNAPNVRVLYDLYHQQIMAGDHITFLLHNLPWIGHFHAAGVPGRHELFTGEMDYPAVIRRVREAGYAGYLGLEYMPLLGHEESLRKTREYLRPALA